MTLPLSKTLDLVDFEELAPELSLVDKHFTREREQHPMRKWEYSLALRAYTTWRDQTSRPQNFAYDVGGAGSPFKLMLGNTPLSTEIIDPEYKEYPRTLEEKLTQFTPILGDAVFCLSVLEHVDDLDRFLFHLACLVAPGGLLFLTADYTDLSPGRSPSDTCHFHWMRRRIFNEHDLIETVIEPLLDRDFSWLGDRDLAWRGSHVYDYSFVSLALVKRT